MKSTTILSVLLPLFASSASASRGFKLPAFTDQPAAPGQPECSTMVLTSNHLVSACCRIPTVRHLARCTYRFDLNACVGVDPETGRLAKMPRGGGGFAGRNGSCELCSLRDGKRLACMCGGKFTSMDLARRGVLRVDPEGRLICNSSSSSSELMVR